MHVKSFSINWIALTNLGHHGQQQAIIANPLIEQKLVAATVLRPRNPYRKQRAKHHHAMAFRELRTGIPIFFRGAPGAVNHHQKRPFHLLLDDFRHIKAVAEALILLAGVKGGGTKVIRSQHKQLHPIWYFL